MNTLWFWEIEFADGDGMKADTAYWRVLIMLILLLVVAITGCGGATEAAAPDFSMTNAIGGTVDLADYAGDPVLLFFHMADG